MRPDELLRKSESLFKEKYKGKTLSDAEWIGVLVRNPVLIERPVLFDDKKGVVGRTPEAVLKMIR